MKTLQLFPATIFAVAFIACGCASTGSAPAERNIYIGENGSFAVLDENGNPVEDEAAEMLGALLSQEMAKANAANELADDEIWSVSANGDLTHIQSGGICPIEWGEFALVKPTIFKRDGSDVGCNYQSQALNSSFTFYIYKNDREIEAELDGVLATMKTRVPTAKSVELNMLGPAPHNYSGRALETELPDGSKNRDSVLITNSSDWQIKLRMSYPAANALSLERLAALMLQGQSDRVRVGFSNGDEDELDETPKIDT